MQTPKTPDATNIGVFNANTLSFPPQKSHSLSTGVMAGIAVGVIAAVALLSIGGAVFYILRSRRYPSFILPTKGSGPSATTELQNSWSHYGGMTLKAELPGSDGVEMNKVIPQEILKISRTELPGEDLEPKELT